MYSNILVPVSFDEDRNATQALEAARCLASEGAKITLLHVVEQMPSYAISYFPEGFREETIEAIRVNLAEMAKSLPGGQAEVIEGHAGASILDHAEELACDCIVIASHRPGMQDYLLGSTAARVVRHATCSVHVVR